MSLNVVIKSYDQVPFPTIGECAGQACIWSTTWMKRTTGLPHGHKVENPFLAFAKFNTLLASILGACGFIAQGRPSVSGLYVEKALDPCSECGCHRAFTCSEHYVNGFVELYISRSYQDGEFSVNKMNHHGQSWSIKNMPPWTKKSSVKYNNLGSTYN